jgi:hypothetical protein
VEVDGEHERQAGNAFTKEKKNKFF